MFKKYSRRTVWSYGHLWLGRAAITLGIINGGLGLQLADNTHKGEVAYAVVAAVMYLLYVGSIVIGESKRRRAMTNYPAGSDKGVQMENVGSGHRAQNQNQEFYAQPQQQRR